MPKKKAENELTPKEQFKRFREKAKGLGIDEADRPLDKAFRRLAKQPSSAKKGKVSQ